MSTPGAARISSLGGDSQMCYMTDTGQSFATEAIGPNRGEIFECFQFGGSEPFAQDGQVIPLGVDGHVSFGWAVRR